VMGSYENWCENFSEYYLDWKGNVIK
jgi:hypothetical protein